IPATRVWQSQTGEKTLAIRGARIGLGSIFRPCVTANAAAVPPSSATTSRVERTRGNPPRVYALPSGCRTPWRLQTGAGRRPQSRPYGTAYGRSLRPCPGLVFACQDHHGTRRPGHSSAEFRPCSGDRDIMRGDPPPLLPAPLLTGER